MYVVDGDDVLLEVSSREVNMSSEFDADYLYIT